MAKTKKPAVEYISKKAKIIMAVLFVIGLLIGTAIYFVYDSWQSSNDEYEEEIFKLGFQYGYESTLTGIFNEALKCELIPLTDENLTINIIAIECLTDLQHNES